MFIERRVFQAKVGEAGAVVEKLKEIGREGSRFTIPGGRIYTDYLSGSTDRVVWEREIESIGQSESAMATAMQDPEQARLFAAWFDGLKPLITGATVSSGTEKSKKSRSASRPGNERPGVDQAVRFSSRISRSPGANCAPGRRGEIGERFEIRVADAQDPWNIAVNPRVVWTFSEGGQPA